MRDREAVHVAILHMQSTINLSIYARQTLIQCLYVSGSGYELLPPAPGFSDATVNCPKMEEVIVSYVPGKQNNIGASFPINEMYTRAGGNEYAILAVSAWYKYTSLPHTHHTHHTHTHAHKQLIIAILTQCMDIEVSQLSIGLPITAIFYM